MTVRGVCWLLWSLLAGVASEVCNTSSLGDGAWTSWQRCLQRDCVVTASGDPRTVASVAAPEPGRVWAPRSCSLRLFRGAEATSCLRERPLLLVGDSTSQGLYEELRLVARDYAFDAGGGGVVDGLRFMRLDSYGGARTPTRILREAAGASTSTIVLNLGAHLAKAVGKANRIKCDPLNMSRFMKRFPHPTAPTFVDHFKNDSVSDRFVVAEAAPDAWVEALAAAKATRCDSRFDRAARDGAAKIAGIFRGLREKGFAGTLVWRNVQINFGYDFRRGLGAHMGNALKLAINAEVARQLDPTDVATLDVERFTASRPETFFHEHSNHFYCICPHSDAPTPRTEPSRMRPGADVRARCQDPVCDRDRRGARHDNGEPNRYLAQMVLHATCAQGRPGGAAEV